MKYLLIKVWVIHRDVMFSYYNLSNSDEIFPYYSQRNKKMYCFLITFYVADTDEMFLITLWVTLL